MKILSTLDALIKPFFKKRTKGIGYRERLAQATSSNAGKTKITPATPGDKVPKDIPPKINIYG